MALPTFVAAGAMSTSATVDITPAIPTGTTTDDIMLMFVETENSVIPAAPAGWGVVWGSPISGTGSTLTVFWKRAGASESSPTIVFVSNHHSAHIETFRGCVTSGEPWSLAYSGVKNTSSTTMSAQGSATPIDEQLIVIAGASGEDITGGRAASHANADLANVTERFDNFSTDGGGGGVAVVTGEKSNAGAFGATTWTWTQSVPDVWMVICLTPVGSTPALPYFIAAGTFASSAVADISPGLPAGWAEGDIFVMVGESVTGGPATPSGWNVVPDSPQTTATGNGATIFAFWRRATSSESAPTVARGALNHIGATIIAIRNCITTGSPWDVTSGGNNDTADAAFSATGDTSTVNNVMVCVFGANGTDTANSQFLFWTNTTTPVFEVFDNFTTAGNGGGAAAALGHKIIAGAYGTTTATLSNAAADVYITGALKPVPGAGGVSGSAALSQAFIMG